MTSGGTALRKAGAVVASALLAGLLTLTLIFFIQDAARPYVLESLSSSSGQSPADVDQHFAEFGLDRPLPQRYVDFLGDAATLDFGPSFACDCSARSVAASAAWPSILLMLTGVIFAMGLARLTAIASIRKPGGLLDRANTSVALSIGAIPFQWFFFFLVWLMIMGLRRHLAVPGLGLGLVLWGGYHVLFRSLALEALALAGKPSRSLRSRRRAAKASWMPMLRLVLTSLGYALTGLFIVEWLFSWPGLGSALLLAFGYQDFPLLLTVFIAVTVPVAAIAAAAATLSPEAGSDLAHQIEETAPRLPDATPPRRRALVVGVAILACYFSAVAVGTLLVGSSQAEDTTAAKFDQPFFAAPGSHCPQSMRTTTSASRVEDCPPSSKVFYPLGTDSGGRSVLATTLWEARRKTIDAALVLALVGIICACASLLRRTGFPRQVVIWLTRWIDSLPAAVVAVFAFMFSFIDSPRYPFAATWGERDLLALLLCGTLVRAALERTHPPEEPKSATRLRPSRIVLAAGAKTVAMTYFTLSAVDVFLDVGPFSEALDSSALPRGNWWLIVFPAIAITVPILGARLIAFGLTPAPVRIEPGPETGPEPGSGP